MKQFIKNILKLSPIPLSKNHRYDILTKKIMKAHLKKNSNCIDVGCHKGEVLDQILKLAPLGNHFGFEPIPIMFENLKKKYQEQENCQILQYALSDKKDTVNFNFVVSNPSYSGLRKRDYDKPNEEDTTIEVETERLDNLLDKSMPISLIKIDVEGAELQVLQGAIDTIKTHKPLVIFEHGKGASEHYGTTPKKIFDFFQSSDMQISTLSQFIKNRTHLDLKNFEEQYEKQINYYFIAHGNR